MKQRVLTFIKGLFLIGVIASIFSVFYQEFYRGLPSHLTILHESETLNGTFVFVEDPESENVGVLLVEQRFGGIDIQGNRSLHANNPFNDFLINLSNGIIMINIEGWGIGRITNDKMVNVQVRVNEEIITEVPLIKTDPYTFFIMNLHNLQEDYTEIQIVGLNKHGHTIGSLNFELQ